MESGAILVLVAARNGELYIGEQLDSILAQTVPGIRILVSDDCSGDHTPEIAREYERRFPQQVQVWQRQSPSGGAAAHFLDLLARTARMEEPPEYVLLSDQDDVWLPYKAEKLLSQMKRTETEGPAGKTDSVGEPGGSRKLPVLIHSDLTVTDEKLNVIAPSFFAYQKVSPQRRALPQLLVQNNVTGGAVMLNRPLLELLKTPPQVCLMHDSWLALVASCFGVISWVDEPLYYYRQHGANALGAEKGDSPEGFIRRMEDGSQARENYRKMFGQARCLLELYGDRLDEKQKAVLEAFIRLPGRSRIGKIAEILRWGFTKNTWIRTLGQMMMIGD